MLMILSILNIWFLSSGSQERMDQIMEEARLCQEKLEELKMAAVQVSTTFILMIMMCGGP